MKSLLNRLEADYPEISFVEGESFYWSPNESTVTYVIVSTQPEVSKWSLLHEVSHGILGHTDYSTDFELMQLEVAAWKKAVTLGKKYGIKIDLEHVEDCLDTYRDWLHRRSTCPTCGVVSLQTSERTYKCINCDSTWRVSNSRFCRPYRMLETTNK